MKTLLLLAGVLLLGSCTAGKETVPSSNSSIGKEQTSPSSTAAGTNPSAVSKSGSTESSEHPVVFTCLGITQDKQSVAYRIEVNTTRPIDEVHIALKETNERGRVLEDTTVVWQNIVKSTRQPIETGKTYEDQSALDSGATKAECSLNEVIFKDGTRWSPR